MGVDQHGTADIAVEMMDNASALPTSPQRQQHNNNKRRLFKKGQNHPHDFTKRQILRLLPYVLAAVVFAYALHHILY
jgi:hypothetical protein